MPIRLVPYDLAAGGRIIVEENVVDQGDLVAGGMGGLAQKAKQTFEEALAGIRPAVSAVLEEITSLSNGPHKVNVEVGFVLKGQVGAVIASSATEASIKLSVTWDRKESNL
ncbi:hypothetical protein Rru_A1286 [Rhodospirillum rubrum ATCC 11170]|uniref:Trypsin-co-occurring domain-containing protein n=1 Tax=Rhodospirillum rubrum (strain ATCC 11170 / ATH 1.1.1 / DSM 467 / LMG 4362 / NCIMB 8255 / S1) TaxID=269796 RepID=Q2RUV8_RHORT|nr:CU044_2847 family protein [Rhodospirillum rubrum]ABC22087.1 hypothetical protein Rru_A1286 [Rhodospirillum rubrum ATCC 11170]MBK5953677.1 hypothetical protein [Rhodospirillum rubrum]QXG81740.1 hypothetical protein KUL73_06705 [Rhodospirillum rubrum]HAP99991.1 hypothetical protein [Rhodospirillum rubrum]HCF16604.1 hypothetical protein [Rhodospirillum rubrum]